VLVLTIKFDEEICIGKDVKLRFSKKSGYSSLKIVIEAPREIEIIRKKIFDNENSNNR